MKKCDICGIDMEEDTNLHTDFVGGATFDKQIFISWPGRPTKRVKARVCPCCGKVELYIELDNIIVKE